MTGMDLLYSLSEVDDQLLLECESEVRARKSFPYKFMLIAAAMICLLSITALAVKFMFTDVSDGELKPAQFKMTMTDSNWNVVEIGTKQGYLVNATIETFEDVPMHLVKPYLPIVPDDWSCNGAASAKYDGLIGVVGVNWNYWFDNMEYEVFYRQESANFYNSREEKTVWWLDHLPEDVTVTGSTTKIVDASVYRVEISGSSDRNFYSYGRSLIFWSDGYSIFQLAVPQYWPDTLIYEMMCSLTLQQDIENALSNLN